MEQLLLATRNPKKLTELRRLFAELVPSIAVVGLGDAGVPDYPEPVEDEPTFTGNARLKARAAAAATGLPSVGDDSGLCVDALNQMPGVLSGRWAGYPRDDARNNALLLDQLADVPNARLGAAFWTVAVLAFPGGDHTAELVAEGTVDGRITRRPAGDNGFGYDPLFVPFDEPAGGRRTFAELADTEKDALSHRGRAMRALAAQLTSPHGGRR